MSLKQYLTNLKLTSGQVIDNRARNQLLNVLTSNDDLDNDAQFYYMNELKQLLANNKATGDEVKLFTSQLFRGPNSQVADSVVARRVPLLKIQTSLSVEQLTELQKKLHEGKLITKKVVAMGSSQHPFHLGSRMKKGKMHDMTIKEAYALGKKKLPVVARVILDNTDLPAYIDKLQSKGTGAKLKGSTTTQIDFTSVAKLDKSDELKRAVLEIREQLSRPKRASFDRLVSFAFMNLQRRKFGQLQLNEAVANCLACFGLLNALRPEMFEHAECVDTLASFLD